MKLIPLAWVTVALLAPMLVVAAEDPSQYEQRREPQRAKPHPPLSPLRFTLAKGKERQSVEVRYIDAKTIAFTIEKSGTCRRHERGRAAIAGRWWLGAETDENEAGEAVAVEEYVYQKDTLCAIYIRIDEAVWSQATIHEAGQCSENCAASAETMHLKKEGKRGTKRKRS